MQPKNCGIFVLILCLLGLTNLQVFGEPSGNATDTPLTYFDGFLNQDVAFPASVPVEVQQRIVSPPKTDLSEQSLSQPLTAPLAVPPGYVLLDSIPPGSLGTTWSLFVNAPGPNPQIYLSEIVSPYDGST
ncbi:MAG: hypothetical protein Q8O19_06920, partial [Rectinemataceae bacterium]|nr:hypothetical protein [Rectinemataceae bacterium]